MLFVFSIFVIFLLVFFAFRGVAGTKSDGFYTFVYNVWYISVEFSYFPC
jgi:hypothetical protein